MRLYAGDPLLLREMRPQDETQLGFDPENEQDAFSYAYQLVIEVSHEIKKIIPKGMRLYVNSFPYEAIAECESHVELECLPTDSIWEYDFAPYYRNFSEERLYMTGRFVTSWGDFGGVKSRAALENDMYDALLYGYGISIGDHLHPSGKLDETLYRNIGEMYAFKEKLEPYTEHAQPVADVCIIRNKETYKKTRKKITSSDRGVCRMLSELKILYDIKDEDMDLSGYRMLILPVQTEITESLYQKLCAFDGSILSSGKAIRNGGIWDFIKLLGDDLHTDAFYKMPNGDVRACYKPAMLMKSEHCVSPYVEAYFDKKYDGKHGYFYIPPKKENGLSAVAVCSNKAHICFDIFAAYHEYSAPFHRDTIKQLIDDLMPDKSLLADNLPLFSRVSIQKKEDKTLLMIKTTYPEFKTSRGVVDEHTSLPAGRSVHVLGTFSSAYSVFGNKPLDIVQEGMYSHVILPEICGFDLIVLN